MATAFTLDRLEETLPEIRPFRALRFVGDSVGDVSDVVAPPYDVLSVDDRARLLARHPRNVVRLDAPSDEAGDEADERYRRAARTLAAWRSDGTLHRDPRAAIYVSEQVYRVPGTDLERTQRGFFGRLRLEPLESGSGVLAHERTLAGPREDRYRLLRATGVNTSPVVGLYEDDSGRAAAILARLAAGKPTVDVCDDDGVRHRLWVVEAEGPNAAEVADLVGIAAAAPITIADGHHRYETALRYRDERRMSRSCEEDPAFDYLLMLFLETTAEPLTVLPAHRIVRSIGDDAVAGLRARLGELFAVRPASRAELIETFDRGGSSGGAGRFGLWTRAGGSFLEARRDEFESRLPSGGPAVRALDVVILGAALEDLLGLDPAAVAGGEQIAYTKSAAEAVTAVDEGWAAADAAFLLEPTPVPSIVAVAREGDVMPQKSTYFYPKAMTGLVINPHEW
ncbi:MAG TPA: DUF1015 domain-containing protein [Candidatus Limnocylindrales bacterium]|nr:DUF1015 domain-containing protein [Candidatus Limnocylindrales bacterium]